MFFDLIFPFPFSLFPFPLSLFPCPFQAAKLPYLRLSDSTPLTGPRHVSPE
jgi:hypothetical protein